jgi:pyruvate dehydrogenase E2 component (dihydrolipoamide acetyltransferase)
MAGRTAASWASVPQFQVVRDVDAAALAAARARLAPPLNAEHVELTYTDLFVAIAARVLPLHRRLNASWADGRVRLHREAHVAIATAVDDGVVAPVIRSAQAARLHAIARQRTDLVQRARSGRLRPADLGGATFTISNLGMYGTRSFTAIVNPPEAAILAIGRVGDRVVAADGRPVVRPVVTLTLSCDHRVVDGARAAAFLDALADAIEHPDRWLEE